MPGYDPATMPRERIRDFQERRKRGEASSRHLVESCLHDIEVMNARLNAVVRVDAQGARAAASDSDERLRRGTLRGPLDGIPLAVKHNIDVAGWAVAAGIGALKTRTPHRDAPCIGRLRDRGAVFLCNTLMDEAALGALGDNPIFGRCHNPHRHGYTAGGSSSGSAAAGAAGLCTAALGTDTLGSVRIPASYCGVVGYVPGAGLVDSAGVVPLAPSLDRVGVLAQSVADAACVAMALSDVIRFETVHCASIGLVRGLESFVSQEILTALDDTARALSRAGHRVFGIDAGALDWARARRAAFLRTEIEGAQVHAALLDDPGAEISRALRDALEFGRHAGAERVERMTAHMEQASSVFLGWLGQCDVLLLPTTPGAAFPFDAEVPSNQADLTAPASIAGLPAVSVPAGAVAGGLPVGAQLVAGRGRDALLLGVAASVG